jgi:hypothetical protein
MKKLFLAIALVLILASTSLAQTAISYGLRTADALLRTGQGQLTGVVIVTDGTNPATVIVRCGCRCQQLRRSDVSYPCII